MRFCGPAHCGTLTWSDGHYDCIYDDEVSRGSYSTYIVERFGPEMVLIKRVDKGAGSAVLTGTISPEGNSIVNGKITYTGLDGTSGTNPFQLTWGSAYSLATGPTARPQPPRTSFTVEDAITLLHWGEFLMDLAKFAGNN